jgi:predicted Rossmann fold nucleotide-binding protein DprA/Smf involved in DNA uptake
MLALLTPNTQAILLLTGPLLAHGTVPADEVLSPGDYNRLARLLRENHRQPADLIGSGAAEVLDLCAPMFGRERLTALLERGPLLDQCVEHWTNRGLWVVSRADATYPHRLKMRLKEDAPPILYGCGDPALLETGGLAVVGSRRAGAGLTAYAEGIGMLAATAQRTLISGGAKGIDRAATHGALENGGAAASILADGLAAAPGVRIHRKPLVEKRLVLVSICDPAAEFDLGHAMQRNKLIYALADAALVVTCEFEKGGTWAGAIEQLERLRFAPVFVRTGAHVGDGNSALLHHGAHLWPNPHDGAELTAAIHAAAESDNAAPKQETLPFAPSDLIPSAEFALHDRAEGPLDTVPAPPSPAVAPSLAGELLAAVGNILRPALTEPRTEDEIATLLNVARPQVRAWLLKLVERGILEKLSKPVRYRAAGPSK